MILNDVICEGADTWRIPHKSHLCVYCDSEDVICEGPDTRRILQKSHVWLRNDILQNVICEGVGENWQI